MNEKLSMIRNQFEDLYNEWNMYKLKDVEDGFEIINSNGNTIKASDKVGTEILSDLALIIKRNGLYVESADDYIQLGSGYDVVSEEGLDELAYEIEDLMGNFIYNLEVHSVEDELVIDYKYIGNPTIGEMEEVDRKIKNIKNRYEFE